MINLESILINVYQPIYNKIIPKHFEYTSAIRKIEWLDYSESLMFFDGKNVLEVVDYIFSINDYDELIKFCSKFSRKRTDDLNFNKFVLSIHKEIKNRLFGSIDEKNEAINVYVDYCGKIKIDLNLGFSYEYNPITKKFRGSPLHKSYIKEFVDIDCILKYLKDANKRLQLSIDAFAKCNI